MERRLQPAMMHPQAKKPAEVGSPPKAPMNKGIYNRGYLPHWDFKGALQAITFLLADSVPSKVIRTWKLELSSMPDDKERQRELHRRIAKYEDVGHGEALLAIPQVAEIVQNKFIVGHPAMYTLIEWCVMPNHVHVMVKLAPGSHLSEIIRIWKGGSSIEINRLLGRSGALWQREYYDRFVRDMDHYHDCRAYIRNNPVKAGLCAIPEDWCFSSAGLGWNGAPASAGYDATANGEAG